MQNAALRKAYLFCFSMVFAVLLISGAPRLIASSENEMCNEILYPVQAFICVSPSMDQHSQQTELDASGRVVLRDEKTMFYASTGTLDSCIIHTDANGNVLVNANYMRSVYQVFALGDGFV